MLSGFRDDDRGSIAGDGQGAVAGVCHQGVHVQMQANMKAALSATMPPNVRGTGFAISALTQGIVLGSGNYMAGRLCIPAARGRSGAEVLRAKQPGPTASAVTGMFVESSRAS